MAAEAALRQAVARLRAADDVETVRGVLLETSEALQADGGSSTAAYETFYARFMDTLLASVLPNWVPCLTGGQRQACFDIWFAGGALVPLHFALLALGRALGADADADVGIVELLRLLLWQSDRAGAAGEPARGLACVLELVEADLATPAGTTSGQAVLGLIVSLPERIANALKREAPRWSGPERFHATVANAAWQLFTQHLHAPPPPVLQGGWGASIVPVLLSRQARLRQAGMIMRVWVPRLLACVEEGGPQGKAAAAMREVLEALSDQAAFEQMIRAVLACLPPFDDSPAPSVGRNLLREMLGRGLQENRQTWRYIVSQKLPVDQALSRTTQSRHSIRYCLDCLLHTDLLDDVDGGGGGGGGGGVLPLVEHALGSIVSVWTDQDFAQHSTIEYHRHLTHTMLYCLQLMEGQATSPVQVEQRLVYNGWIGELMHGVQRRFDNTNPSVRMLAMLVAERLSELINPDKPLRFDEVAAAKELLKSYTAATGGARPAAGLDELADVDYFWDDPEEQTNAAFVESKASLNVTTPPRVTPDEDESAERRSNSTFDVDGSDDGSRRGDSAGRLAEEDDPDAVLAPAYNDDSSCDSSGESSASDDDDDESVISLEPYAIPSAATQGRSAHRPPKHVREVIVWLRLPKDPTPTDYDRYEAALRNLGVLLYDGAGGGVSAGALHDEAVELITLLIHLQDALVDDPNDDVARASFPQLRHDALVATVVHAPAVACIHLAFTVYSDNCSIATRLDCLRALEDGSTQLANPSKRRQRLAPSDASAQEPEPEPEPEQLAGAQGTATQSQPKTRRWGHTAMAARGEQVKEPTAYRNEFAEYASPVIFTLISQFDETGGTADYLRTEPVFVAKLLHCVAVMYEAAGHAPGLPRIAERLGELCWQLRRHSEASVRRAVLVVFAQLIMTTNLSSATAHGGGDAGEWLRDVAMDDTDGTCREVAKTCLGASGLPR